MSTDANESVREALRPVPHGLASLPGQSRQLAARFVHELNQRPGAQAPPFLVLPRVDLRVRLHLVRQKSGRFLVFFKRHRRSEAVFAAEAQFTITPLAESLAPLPEAVADLPCQLALPRFILDRGANPVRLQAGPNPEDVLEIGFLNNAASSPKLRLAGQALSDGQWPLRPFLELFRSLRAWLAEELPSGPEFPVRPFTPDEAQEGRQVLFDLLECWRQTQELLAQAEPFTAPATPPTVADCLRTPFGITGFLGELELRVRADGTLAEANDNETTQVRLRAELVESEGHWQVRLGVRPPDFLVAGQRFEALRHHFAATLAKKVYAELRAAQLPVFPEEVPTFIRDGASEAMVLRTARQGDEDRELLVLQGVLVDRPVVVLLEDWVRLTPQGPKQVKRDGSPKVLHAAPLVAGTPRLNSKAQESLQDLAVAARNWLRVLP